MRSELQQSLEILDWRRRRSWQYAFRQFAGHLLDGSVRDHLVRNKPRACWSDNFSWLPSPDVVEEIAWCLREHYSHVKGFHASRPRSVKSYYELGLMGLDVTVAQKSFKEIFADVDELKLEAAIDQMATRNRLDQGKIYFCADEETLIKESGHYLIQGSEYLMALAATLMSGSGEDYRLRLRKFGVPTIFEVDIPIECVPFEQTFDLARLMTSAWGQTVTKRRLGLADSVCYVIHGNIEPSNIRSHFHPMVVADPHFGRVPYRIDKIDCDMCQQA